MKHLSLIPILLLSKMFVSAQRNGLKFGTNLSFTTGEMRIIIQSWQTQVLYIYIHQGLTCATP
ncbi:MAG: hypothetical protein ACK5L5_00495 [Bacteroidales bacterium]